VQSYQLSGDTLYIREKGSLQVVAAGLTGKIERVIVDGVIGDFLVDSEKLFFKNSVDNNYLYCLDLRTDNKHKLCEDIFDTLAAIDGDIYGFSGAGSIFRVKMDGTEYRKLQ
jgi:hypothetical protein